MWQRMKRYGLCSAIVLGAGGICTISLLLWSYLFPMWCVLVWHAGLAVILYRFILRASVFPSSLAFWRLLVQKELSRSLQRQLRKNLDALCTFTQAIDVSQAERKEMYSEITSNPLLHTSYAFSNVCWTLESLQHLRTQHAQFESSLSPELNDGTNRTIFRFGRFFGHQARYLQLKPMPSPRTPCLSPQWQLTSKHRSFLRNSIVRGAHHCYNVVSFCLSPVSKFISSQPVDLESINRILESLKLVTVQLETYSVLLPSYFGVPHPKPAACFPHLPMAATPLDGTETRWPPLKSYFFSAQCSANYHKTANEMCENETGETFLVEWKLVDLLWNVYIRHQEFLVCSSRAQVKSFHFLCHDVFMKMLSPRTTAKSCGADQNTSKTVSTVHVSSRLNIRAMCVLTPEPVLGHFDYLRTTLLLKYNGIQFGVTLRDRTRKDAVFLPRPCSWAARHRLGLRFRYCCNSDVAEPQLSVAPNADIDNNAFENSHDASSIAWTWGPVVIFFNPNANMYESAAFDNPWINFYLAEQFNVILFNYRGCGRSEGYPTIRTICRDAEDLVEFLINPFGSKNHNQKTPRFGLGIPSLGVHGRSIGGAAAIQVASKFPTHIKWLFADRTFKDLGSVAMELMGGSWARLALNLGGYAVDNVQKYASLRKTVKVIGWDPEDTIILDASSLKAGLCEWISNPSLQSNSKILRTILSPVTDNTKQDTEEKEVNPDLVGSHRLLLAQLVLDQQGMALVDELFCISFICTYALSRCFVPDLLLEEFLSRFSKTLLRYSAVDYNPPCLHDIKLLLAPANASLRRLHTLLSKFEACGVSLLSSLLSPPFSVMRHRAIILQHFITSLQLWGSLNTSIPIATSNKSTAQSVGRSSTHFSSFLRKTRHHGRILCRRVAEGFCETARHVSQLCAKNVSETDAIPFTIIGSTEIKEKRSETAGPCLDPFFLNFFTRLLSHQEFFFGALSRHLERVSTGLCEEDLSLFPLDNTSRFVTPGQRSQSVFQMEVKAVDGSPEALGFIVPLHCGHNGCFSNDEADATRFYLGMSLWDNASDDQ